MTTQSPSVQLTLVTVWPSTGDVIFSSLRSSANSDVLVITTEPEQFAQGDLLETLAFVWVVGTLIKEVGLSIYVQWRITSSKDAEFNLRLTFNCSPRSTRTHFSFSMHMFPFLLCFSFAVRRAFFPLMVIGYHLY